MKLTVDRLPLVALGGILLVSWICADYFVNTVTITAPSPELEVWSRYDRVLAVQLICVVCLALITASIPGANPLLSVKDVLARIATLAVKYRWLWPALAILGISIQIAVKGPLILSSPEYLESNAPRSMVVLATTPAPLYMTLTGLVSRNNRILGMVLGISCGLVLFAYGTRLFAASYLLYSLGRWLGGNRATVKSSLVAIASVPILFPIPLAVRGSSAHGFFPYLDAASRFVQSGNYFDQLVATVAGNIGFGIPLLCYIVQLDRITTGDMIVSVNPVSGEQAGWREIEQLLRVHEFIPYSALGEWGSFGLPALFLAVLSWALVVRLCINILAKVPGFFGLAATLATVALASYSAVLATQYNTRNVVRMLSFVVLVAATVGIGYWLTERIKVHRMARKGCGSS